MTITIFSVATRAMGFIYKIILSRILSSELLGIMNISLSIFGVFTTIICSGITITISRYVSINNQSNMKGKNANLIFSSLLLTSALAIIISTLLILGKDLLTTLLSSYQSYMLLICMIPALFSNAVYTPFRAYLQGKENYLHSSLVELVEQILRIIVCFLVFLIFKDIDAIYAPAIAMCVAGVLSTILGIYYFKKNEGKLAFSKPKFKILISKSTPITLVKLLSSLVMPLITIIIPLRLMAVGYTNQDALSLLGIATGMTLPLISVPGTIIGSLAMALIPQISALYENDQKQNIINQTNASINFTIITTMIFVPIFIGLGKPICEFVFANTTAGLLLTKASWIMLPMGISQITTTILNSMGYEKNTFIYYLISGIFMAICIYFLPAIIGIEAVIWAMASSSIFVSIANIYKINKVLKTKIRYIKQLVVASVLSIPLHLFMSYLYNIFIYILPKTMALIIVAGLGLVTTTLLFTAFKLINIDIIKSRIKLRVRKKLKKI